MDAHHDLIACRNGVIDLRTGMLRPHDPGLLLTRRVDVDYGDRSRVGHATTSRHRYRRGRFTLTVTARDRAGNVTRKGVKLRMGSWSCARPAGGSSSARGRC